MWWVGSKLKGEGGRGFCDGLCLGDVRPCNVCLYTVYSYLYLLYYTYLYNCSYYNLYSYSYSYSYFYFYSSLDILSYYGSCFGYILYRPSTYIPLSLSCLNLLVLSEL